MEYNESLKEVNRLNSLESTNLHEMFYAVAPINTENRRAFKAKLYKERETINLIDNIYQTEEIFDPVSICKITVPNLSFIWARDTNLILE